MAITVNCSCRKQLTVGEELAGKRVRCPGCGGPVVIPPSDRINSVAEPAAAARTPVAPPDPGATLAENHRLRDQIRQLETAQRWYAAILALVFALSMLLSWFSISLANSRVPSPAGAQASPADKVTARQFILVDEQGRARAALQLSASGQPRLVLEGNEGSSVSVGFQDAAKDFPNLAMYDVTGKRRLGATLTLYGPEMVFHDESGQPGITMTCSRLTGPSLSLAKRPTEGSAQMGLFSNGAPFLDLIDAEGNAVASFPPPK
jgi:hypothetical protein